MNLVIRLLICFVSCASCFSLVAHGEYVVLTDERNADLSSANIPEGVPIFNVGSTPEWPNASYFNAKLGVLCGQFPALVDTVKREWTPITGTFSDARVALSVQIQLRKTEPQNFLESDFFELCRTVETTAGVTPTTDKLGFDEIEAYIDIIAATDPMTAMKLSLKLMSINSALMRYDLLWWDYAKDFSSSGVPDE